MARADLYIDIDREESVESSLSQSIVPLPLFAQWETLSLRIYLLQSAGQLANPPYTRVPTTGKLLQVAIGTRVGTPKHYYAAQFTWSENSDLADPYFYADLALSTAEVNTLIGTGTQATAWLEVRVLESGLPRTILLKEITIFANVIGDDGSGDGGVTAPDSQTPLSLEVANAIYLQHTFTGPVIMTDGAGNSVRLWVDADGFHADKIT